VLPHGRRFSRKLERGDWRADPEGSDPECKYLPVTYVSRDFEGLMDSHRGRPEFETEKEPLSLTNRAERNRRNAAPRRGSPNRLPIRLRIRFVER